MTGDQLDHAIALRNKIKTLGIALEDWEKAEEPVMPPAVHRALDFARTPPTDLLLADRDAWSVYRRACIKKIGADLDAAKRELQLL